MRLVSGGFVYVAFVVDVFSRMIVGWSLATHLRTELPLAALEHALWHRRHQTLDDHLRSLPQAGVASTP